MTRISMVAGNWKMNAGTEYAKAIIEALDTSELKRCGTEVVVCPPACFLSIFDGSGVKTAGQDVSANTDGAYTGEISAKMLKQVGCEYVIVGHSERRQMHSETSDIVAQKAVKAIDEGLKPIVCVGEPLDIREQGGEEQHVEQQLIPVLEKLTEKQLLDCVIAYEPVWAIGTGKTASPEQAQQMHGFIRGLLRANKGSEVADGVRILYGGSVKPENADTLFKQADIDGGLIGGASLDVESFTQICLAK